VAYGESQAQRFLTDGACRPLHRFRDFGHGRFALRVRFEIANMFLGPSNTLTSSNGFFRLVAISFLTALAYHPPNPLQNIKLDSPIGECGFKRHREKTNMGL
jgi:hypothetical protein